MLLDHPHGIACPFEDTKLRLVLSVHLSVNYENCKYQ